MTSILKKLLAKKEKKGRIDIFLTKRIVPVDYR